MTSKECEEQLNQLIIDWDEDRETMLNATDIEAIKHLMLENEMQHKEISKLKQPTIFIDTQDMEERYAEGLYMDYLKEENQQLKDRINKAIERLEALIIFWKKYNPIDNTMQVEQFNGVISLLKEDNKEKVDENN